LEYPAIGLDCQWKITTNANGVRSPIALLQIASHKGNIALIPMRDIHTMPANLRSLLRDKNIIKAGIETMKDAKYLHEDYGLEVNGTYDLRFLAEETNNRPEGLEGLAKQVLDLDIGRQWETISSDWDAEKLENHQIEYAETAVKASIDIFKTLISFVVDQQTKKNILDHCRSKVDCSYVWYSQNW